MAKPDFRYPPEDATHFENANSVTFGMTIEYYLRLRFMIPGESRCSFVTRLKS